MSARDIPNSQKRPHVGGWLRQLFTKRMIRMRNQNGVLKGNWTETKRAHSDETPQQHFTTRSQAIRGSSIATNLRWRDFGSG
jgi:hypothetical protein